MFAKRNPNSILTIIYFVSVFLSPLVYSRTIRLNPISELDESLVYLWPLPSYFTFGSTTLSIDPDLSLTVGGNGGTSVIVSEAFERYKTIIFKHSSSKYSKFGGRTKDKYDISSVSIVVQSDEEEVSSIFILFFRY